jgi:hypothetical protein
MTEKQITITLSPDQARILRDAIDLLHRLKLGQVEELRDVWLDRCKDDWDKREGVEILAGQIKRIVFPELSGSGHSYGVGSDLGVDVQRMYEIYKVLDHALWRCEPVDKRFTTNAGDPYLLRYSGDPKIPFEVRDV